MTNKQIIVHLFSYRCFKKEINQFIHLLTVTGIDLYATTTDINHWNKLIKRYKLK